jgi:hypothetical protein
MPRNADELNLNCHPFRGSNELQTHRFVDNAAIAPGKRQRVADVVGDGGDIEQQPRFAWVSLLGEVQPKFAVLQRLSAAYSRSLPCAKPRCDAEGRRCRAPKRRRGSTAMRLGRRACEGWRWPAARRTPSRLAKLLFPPSRSTLRVRELRDCAADLTAIEGANDNGARNRRGHAPTAPSLVIDLLDSLTKPN